MRALFFAATSAPAFRRISRMSLLPWAASMWRQKFPLLVLFRDVCPSVLEHRDHSELFLLARQQQRCVAHIVLCSDICARGYEHGEKRRRTAALRHTMKGGLSVAFSLLEVEDAGLAFIVFIVTQQQRCFHDMCCIASIAGLFSHAPLSAVAFPCGIPFQITAAFPLQITVAFPA